MRMRLVIALAASAAACGSSEIDGGGRARYALHRHVHLGARIELGTARNSLTIEGNGHAVSDASWGGTVTAALSLDLLFVALPRFSMGFDLGYVAASAVALSPREAGDSSKIELDAMQASIGHLDLGGRFVSLSVLSQF